MADSLRFYIQSLFKLNNPTFKKLAVPAVALREGWYPLLDTFSEHTIQFTVSLQGIQTLYSEVGISI